MKWLWREFAQLSPQDLYDVLALRQRVFVVEQNCAYQDVDGLDPKSTHLLGRDEGGALVAYLRIVPAGVKFKEISIGRVVTAPESRSKSYGRAAMAEALKKIGSQPIRIGAQTYLERFYASFGFRRIADNYLEDGIPHLEMLR